MEEHIETTQATGTVVELVPEVTDIVEEVTETATTVDETITDTGLPVEDVIVEEQEISQEATESPVTTDVTEPIVDEVTTETEVTEDSVTPTATTVDLSDVTPWTNDVTATFTLDENVGLFKNIIKAISTSVNEIELCFTDTGLVFRAMDTAAVSLISGTLSRSAFTVYELSRPFAILVLTSSLQEKMKAMKTVNHLEFSFEENLILKATGKTQKKFSISLLESGNYQRPNEPELESAAVIHTTPAIFSDAIADAKLVEDVVSFKVSQDSASFAGEAYNGETAETNLTNEDNTTWSLSGDTESQRSRYSIEFINKFITGLKLFPEIDIGFGNDYPCTFSGKTPDNLLSIKYVLAPRVEGD